MKEKLQKWLGIDALHSRVNDLENGDFHRRIRTIEGELTGPYLGGGSIPNGLKEHLVALMRYLDVLPYIEIHDDPARMVEHPTIQRVVVDKRKNLKYQFVDKSSNAQPLPKRKRRPLPG